MPVGWFMRRVTLPLVLLLLLIPTALAQESNSVVAVSTELFIGESDMGIDALAVSPSGEDMLLIGTLGYAHFIAAGKPFNQVQLNSNDQDDLNDVDWHPQGLTALIAGDDGTLLRYTRDDHSVTHVPGSTANLLAQNLNAVTWDSSGNWAYIGAASGVITRFREDANGNTEYFPLNNSKSSPILDISCLHKMHAMCLVATESNGLAVIDQQHELHWLPGSEGTRWFSVECPHVERDRCFGVGQGHSVGIVELDLNNPASSFVLVKNVEISGEFTGIHVRDKDHLLFQTAPFGWVDWDIKAGTDEMGLAYPWLDNSDATGDDVALRGETLVGGWSINSDEGYAVTSYGRVVYYYPPQNTISENLVAALAPMLVIIAVPGVVVGLIYMSSPALQKRYMAWSNGRLAAKREAAKVKKGQLKGKARKGAKK